VCVCVCVCVCGGQVCWCVRRRSDGVQAGGGPAAGSVGQAGGAPGCGQRWLKEFECLSTMHEALSSNFLTTAKRNRVRLARCKSSGS
jgi:hypothetical protein